MVTTILQKHPLPRAWLANTTENPPAGVLFLTQKQVDAFDNWRQVTEVDFSWRFSVSLPSSNPKGRLSRRPLVVRRVRLTCLGQAQRIQQNKSSEITETIFKNPYRSRRKRGPTGRDSVATSHWLRPSTKAFIGAYGVRRADSQGMLTTGFSTNSKSPKSYYSD